MQKTFKDKEFTDGNTSDIISAKQTAQSICIFLQTVHSQDVHGFSEGAGTCMCAPVEASGHKQPDVSVSSHWVPLRSTQWIKGRFLPRAFTFTNDHLVHGGGAAPRSHVTVHVLLITTIHQRMLRVLRGRDGRSRSTDPDFVCYREAKTPPVMFESC